MTNTGQPDQLLDIPIQSDDLARDEAIAAHERWLSEPTLASKAQYASALYRYAAKIVNFAMIAYADKLNFECKEERRRAVNK